MVRCSQNIALLRDTGKIAPNNSPSAKTQGIWKCCRNIGKFSNSKDPTIAIFAVKLLNFSKSFSLMKLSQISDKTKKKKKKKILTMAQGKCPSGQGKHREFVNRICK